MIETLLLNWLAFTPVMAMPLLLAALGTIVAGRAGLLNLGTEGMMLVGALAGVMATLHSGTPWLGVLAAPIAGGMLAAVFALACVTLRANQVVIGLILVALGAGLTGLIGPDYSQRAIAAFDRVDLPLLSDIPWLGRIVFSQDPFLYACLPVVGFAWWFLVSSHTGLRLRAVGESPETADAAGVPIQTYRWAAVIAGGALCGLAGCYLALASSRIWVEGMTNGRGWIAIAIVIFARWSPGGAVIGALLFGSIEALVPRLQATGIAVPTFILFMLPYLTTLLVLTISALLRRHSAIDPDALGQPYAREDRH